MNSPTETNSPDTDQTNNESEQTLSDRFKFEVSKIPTQYVAAGVALALLLVIATTFNKFFDLVR